MAENVRLADIYIKIYNKRAITMDDLAFLAKYDPECFEKTCHNLVYNEPEAKKLMKTKSPVKQEEPPAEADVKDTREEVSTGVDLYARMKLEEQAEKIDTLFENLKKMEGQEIELQKLSFDNVKHLLGSLFMEKLFPHNDRDRSFDIFDDEQYSTFNKKV